MSTVHRAHPRGDDPVDALLWDDCDRCGQIADRPVRQLDTGRLHALWERTMAVEAHDQDHWRTRTEQRAGLVLWDAAALPDRLDRGVR